jgi:ATP-dependent DNA helicase RecG
VPTFRVADPLRDEELNLLAQEVAAEVLEQDPELTRDEHAGLRRVLSERYGRAIELFRVG